MGALTRLQQATCIDSIEEQDIDGESQLFLVQFSDGDLLQVRVPLKDLEERGRVSSYDLPTSVIVRRAARAYLRDRAHGLAAWRRRDERAARAAFGVLSWCEALLPRRLRDEDLGDAFEDVARFQREGRPGGQILAKAITTALVLLVNGIREVASALIGKRSSGS